MKRIIKLKLEINDDYIKQWSDDILRYHTNLYNGDEEKARQTLKENPVEKAIANEIEEYVVDYISGVSHCKATVVKE